MSVSGQHQHYTLDWQDAVFSSAFSLITKGMEIVTAIEKFGLHSGATAKAIAIADCDQIA